jgi:hypothetical protein
MDLNNFGPLDPAIWGTVSDWFMFAVTFFTALYLVKTFKSQKKIQDLQEQLHRIESIRFTNEMQPRFSAQSSYSDIETFDSGEDIKHIIHLYLTNTSKGTAKNIRISYFDQEENTQEVYSYTFGYPNELLIPQLPVVPIIISYDEDANPNYIVDTDLVVRFFDMENNEYEQEILYQWFKKKATVSISPAKLITPLGV